MTEHDRCDLCGGPIRRHTLAGAVNVRPRPGPWAHVYPWTDQQHKHEAKP